MQPMNSITVSTPYGDKTVSVYCTDILKYDGEIDILTTSAFYRSYEPTPRTMFNALYSAGISVPHLAQDPQFDLRKQCNVWLSWEIIGQRIPVRRLGCIEMSPYSRDRSAWKTVEHTMLSSLKAYFHMLDIAAACDVKMDTVAMPLLGAGSQQIDYNLTLLPILNECMDFLKRNASVKHIVFIEYNQTNAFKIAMALENSYSFHREKIAPAAAVRSDCMAFISYSSNDKNIADNMCAKLEQQGIKVWYAPRNIRSNDYATAIVEAITQSSHFIVIISQNSLKSQHVLNEIDIAFKELSRGIRFIPFIVDGWELNPAFSYYLSRQHWMDARLPPLEQRLCELSEKISCEME